MRAYLISGGAQVGQIRALRVAAALAKTRHGAAYTVDEIATDARELYKLANSARAAVEKHRDPAGHESKASEILSRYGGELVPQRDAAGCVMGARFTDGPRTGFQSIFFLS